MKNRDHRSLLSSASGPCQWWFRVAVLCWVLCSLSWLPQPLAADEPTAETFDLGTLPDVRLLNQEGESVRLRSDVIDDHLVAINFIFTRCATICSPMGAIFGELQGRMPEGGRLVSISVDPTYDTPERLKAWSARFGADHRWTLLTGEKKEIDTLLKRLGVFTPVIEEHAPVILLGNPATQNWRRAYGLAAPAVLAQELEELASTTRQVRFSSPARRPRPQPQGTIRLAASPAAQPNEKPALQDYLTDVRLMNQYGEPMRLFSDLVQGKTVVVNSFFGTCKEACPTINHKMAQIQAALGNRLGSEVHLLSITVDPEHDTPARLRTLSEGYEARKGWYFLTGSKENVDFALSRLGYFVDAKESHKNVFTIGNERTGLWKKALGVGSAETLIETVLSVVNDRGEQASGGRASSR